MKFAKGMAVMVLAYTGGSLVTASLDVVPFPDNLYWLGFILTVSTSVIIGTME